MLRSMRVIIILAIFIGLTTPQAEGNLSSAGGFRVGEVTLPDSSVAKGDFMVMVFSEGMVHDPALPNESIKLPESDLFPMNGCLSVANLQLHSGIPNLSHPATLTFACSAVPTNAEVYGWINKSWVKQSSNRTANGLVQIEFTALTTYAIFLKTPETPILDHFGQI